MDNERMSSPPPANWKAPTPPPDANAPASITRHDSHGASSSTGHERPSTAPAGLRRQPSIPLRRKSSIASNLSRSMHESTESLLLPRAGGHARDRGEESPHWHSVPLAIAILPALGGLLFENGSAFITDIFLLGLGGLFLNWFVRMPW